MDVELKRVPLAWDRPQRLAMARLYFALERLHRLDLHDRVFDALHREHQTLYVPGNEAATLKLQRAFAQSHGIDPEAFEVAWHAATSAIERANRSALALQIPWVPSVVIDDTYVTDLGKAKGPARLIMLLDDLIDRERRARR